MNTIADKLAAAENHVNEILGQWSPLIGRLEKLDRELSGVSETITRLSQESQAVRGEIGTARQGLEQVLAILAETKTEGADLTAKQEENEHLCNTLTSMFGEAFQVVSRFLETAQKIGIIDKNKTQEILDHASATETIVEPVTDAPVVEEAIEPVAEETVIEEAIEPIAAEPAVEEVVEPITAEPVVEEAIEPIAEEPVVEDTVGEQLADILEDELPGTSSETETDLEPPTMPGLPDVTSATDSLPPVDDTIAETETQSPEEIAMELDLPPLQLGASSDTLDGNVSEEEEQRIEDLLTDLTKPISTE